ncbi:MAG: hypothetical protein HZC38_21140 [Chloroflexi bacterium]|nr:hypothetical protein [Chloroflexota bacterium]MBI5715913.1 hypothetical protein [Chloroflexota bacterium]
MPNQPTTQLAIHLDLGESDPEELDRLTRQLRDEIKELNVESAEMAKGGDAPAGTKSAELILFNQMIVTLAPTLIPQVVALIKGWTERRPITPVKIKVVVGKKNVEAEFDPLTTSSAEIEKLVAKIVKTLDK